MDLIKDLTLINLSKEKGFSSRNNLIHPNNAYYYLWMCELQRWLREKHNIKVFVIPSTAADDGKTITHYLCDVYVNNLMSIMTKDFDTYEEALEAGLYKALKLIKKIK